MLQLTHENPYDLLSWAAKKLGLPQTWPADSVPIGILRDGELIGVWVYNLFHDTQASVHLATDHTRTWASRAVMGALFTYGFEYRRLTRLNAVIPESNKRALVAAAKLGFTPEGRMRCGDTNGRDAILFAMLAHECRWLKPLPQPAMEASDG